MSEAFIERARTRLAAAIKTADQQDNQLGVEMDALAAVVESAIRAVDDDGCLPSHLCTAVVKYGAGK